MYISSLGPVVNIIIFPNIISMVIFRLFRQLVHSKNYTSKVSVAVIDFRGY